MGWEGNEEKDRELCEGGEPARFHKMDKPHPMTNSDIS